MAYKEKYLYNIYMKEKKNKSDLYIAITHWLTSGFVVPLILVFLTVIALGMFLPEKDPVVYEIIMIFLSPIIYWLGTMYGANYINKTYIIKNKDKIAKISALTLLIIGGGFRLLGFINSGVLKLEFIGFGLILITFYIASKKYIKNSTL